MHEDERKSCAALDNWNVFTSVTNVRFQSHVMKLRMLTASKPRLSREAMSDAWFIQIAL